MNYICVKCRRRTVNALGCYNPGCGGHAFVYAPIIPGQHPLMDWELRLRLPLKHNAVPLGALAALNPNLVR